MAEKNEIYLKVDHICKWFPMRRKISDILKGKPGNYVKSVDDVSFEIFKGENLGVVGESGCGKSTLARTITRIYEPTSGQIFLDGKDISKISGKALRKAREQIQMVFQDPYSSLDPKMTVYATLREILLVHKVCNRSDVDAHIEKLLTMTGLSKDVASRYPGEFSGGQRQRICIARALASNPGFIIADEPVSALDVSIQAQILNLLNSLQKELNLTVMFISHDLNVIRHISNRVIVMYLGSIVEEGKTEDIFSHPLHPYTQILLKASPDLDPLKKKEKNVIEGDLPSPIHMPNGCRFHPRCPYCKDICMSTRPKLQETADGRKVACHFPLKMNKEENHA